MSIKVKTYQIVKQGNWELNVWSEEREDNTITNFELSNIHGLVYHTKIDEKTGEML